MDNHATTVLLDGIRFCVCHPQVAYNDSHGLAFHQDELPGRPL